MLIIAFDNQDLRIMFNVPKYSMEDEWMIESAAESLAEIILDLNARTYSKLPAKMVPRAADTT